MILRGLEVVFVLAMIFLVVAVIAPPVIRWYGAWWDKYLGGSK
jgi:hypothetical protein